MGRDILMKHMTIECFLCELCGDVVSDPVECRMCEKMFCSGCLVGYLNRTTELVCPVGCRNTTFEKVGHAYERLLGFIYAKCKYGPCPYEDSIKFIHKHEQACQFKDMDKEFNSPDDKVTRRDEFWIGLLTRLMNPNQFPFGFPQTPTPSSLNANYNNNNNNFISPTPNSYSIMHANARQTFTF